MEKHLKVGVALALALVMLSGCSLLSLADKLESKKDDPTPTPTATEEVRDYSKYNAYLALADKINEVEGLLSAYFTNVEYAETFALAEGGSYDAIQEAFQFYTANTYPVTEALDYVDEEPAYPQVDAAVRALGESPAQVMEALDDIAGYIRFKDYEKDDLAKAPELHAALWEALEIYDAYYADFMTAVEEMAKEGREEDEKNLLEDGELILYHSICMIHASQDVLDEIEAQVDAAIQAAVESGAESFEYPVLDRTELAPLFDKFQKGYDGFTEAMESAEEKEKVFSGKLGESSANLYTKKVENLYVKMGELAEAILEEEDYVDAYDEMLEASNSLVDGYNSIN